MLLHVYVIRDALAAATAFTGVTQGTHRMNVFWQEAVKETFLLQRLTVDQE